MATPHVAVQMPQPQAPTYNHPCGDLIDGGRRDQYLDIIVPLYRATMEGDWATAKTILQDKQYLVRYSISERKETPLHVAATSHNTEFVVSLMNIMEDADLELQNIDGNTAFCVAAITGNVSMVEAMVVKNSALSQIRGSHELLPLHLAAFHGNRDVANLLYDQSKAMKGWTNKNMDEVLLKFIQGNIFDVALEILKEKEHIPQDAYAYDVLLLLAQKPRAFRKITITTDVIKSYLTLAYFKTRHALKERSATLLLSLLWKRIMKRPKDIIDNILRGPMIIKNGVQTYPSQVLFIAAEMDNMEFLVELIRGYPDLIWNKNDDGQTIFHISSSFRNQQTTSLLNEIGSMKNLITPLKDQQGNNILHLAAKKPRKNVYDEARMATPSQFYMELVWFKEVEKLLPPPYRNVKNAEGQTPKELFITNHEEQASKCVEWIHGSINQSMVVATLVCAIGFSMVYQIPGGFDQTSGYPIFLKHNSFQGYILASLVSFILSTFSVAIFLHIILSHTIQDGFSLYGRWMFGQLFLLLSLFFLVDAYIISFFVLYPHVEKGQMIVVSTFYGSIVLVLLCFMYYDLRKNVILMDAVRLRRKHFFPQKRKLY